MLTGQDPEKDDMEVALEELMIEEDDNKRTCAGQEKKIDARRRHTYSGLQENVSEVLGHH